MGNVIYESPQIEKVSISLEQSIAGSVPVLPNDPGNQFDEVWKEETITTGNIDIEIL